MRFSNQLDILAHVLISLFLGLLFYWTSPRRTPKVFFICLLSTFVSGVLVDLDHLIDYFLVLGPPFNLSTFLSEKYFNYGLNYVLFHAYEFVILLFIPVLVSKQRLVRLTLAALAVGLLFHLLIDIYFGVSPINYFLLYRIIHNFRV